MGISPWWICFLLSWFLWSFLLFKSLLGEFYAVRDFHQEFKLTCFTKSLNQPVSSIYHFVDIVAPICYSAAPLSTIHNFV